MADDIKILDADGNSKNVRADELAGAVYAQATKIILGGNGAEDGFLDGGQQAMAASLPVAIASDQSAVSVSDGGGSLTVDGAVTVSGTVTANTGLSQPLTDAQLRASAVPVSGTISTGLSQPLTDAQLRAAAVPVADGGGSITVDGAVTLGAALPAGTNNIGDVDVVSLPALPAGNNNVGDVDVASIAAGTNHIGEVTTNGVILTPSITVDTAVYAAGDCVGGKITLTNAIRAAGEKSLLVDVHILDRSGQKPAGNILIFDSDPTAATITDNAAFVYSTDDLKQIAAVPVATGDYVTVNSKCFAVIKTAQEVQAASGTNLYAVFVTSGTPDFVAGTDLQIRFKFAFL